MRGQILNYSQYRYVPAEIFSSENRFISYTGILGLAGRLKRQVELKMRFMVFVFTALVLASVTLYIIEINRIMLYGRKISALEIVLRDLSASERLKRADLAREYAPTKVKQEALGGEQMVEVSTILYVQDSEAVAANLIISP